jgi:hypothetical protein
MYYPSLRALSLIASQPGEDQALLESGYANESNIHKPRPPRFIRDSSLIRPAAFVVLSIIFVL